MADKRALARLRCERLFQLGNRFQLFLLGHKPCHQIAWSG